MLEKTIEQQDYEGNVEYFHTKAGAVNYSHANMTNVSNVGSALDYINTNFATKTGIGVQKGAGENSVVSINADKANEAAKNGISIGTGVKAGNYNCALGKFNSVMSGSTLSSQLGDAFAIGNGTSDTNRSNALRVDMSGNVFSGGVYNTGNADFAEMYEWLDGNVGGQDRRGRFVTIDGEKIRFAQKGDDIDGITSAIPCLCGDNAEYWNGKYELDVYGAIVYEKVVIIEDGKKIEAYQKKISPDYDPTQPFIPRSERKEWAYVGQMGKIVVDDDGTCKVGKKCNVLANGVATISDEGWKVLKRIDSSHVLVHFYVK